MAEYKSISQFARRVQKDVEKAKKRAINRALTSARAEYSKAVGAETGLKASLLRGRVRFEQGPGSDVKNVISIGIKRFFNAHDFTVRAVKVMSRIGRRIGAEYRTKTSGFTFLPGSFIIKGKSSGKKIVMHRTSAHLDSIKETKVDVFRDSVFNNTAAIRKALSESFKKNFGSSLDFFRRQ